VISTIILAALAYLGRSFLLPLLVTASASMWSAVKKASTWFFSGTVGTPAWLFCVLSGASLILLTFAVSKIRREVNEPSWRDYLTDNFFGIKWRWAYASSGQINNPLGYCPGDDTLLVYRKEYAGGSMFMGESHAITLHCETCGRQFGPFEGNDTYLCAKVERQIDRKVRNGEWKSAFTIAKAEA